MANVKNPYSRLTKEELLLRLEEAEETLRAIHSGEVDARGIARAQGEGVFTPMEATLPYQTLVEEMSEGALTLTLQGMILYCNPRFAEILGLPGQAILGEFLLHFVVPGDQARAREFLEPNPEGVNRGQLTLSGGQAEIPVGISIKTIKLGGEVRLGVVVSDLSGPTRVEAELRRYQVRLEQLVGERTHELELANESMRTARLAALNLMEDALGSQKLAEQASERLRVSESRYRSLFNSMTEGFALHEIICDEAGKPYDYRFLEVNPAFETLTGLKQEQVVGKTHKEVLPNDGSHWLEEYGAVALTGKPVHFEDYSADLRQYYEIFSYRPAPNQFAVIFMNVTERKQAEAALRESEARFRSQFQELNLIYKSSPVGLFTVDRDLRYVRINEQLAEINGRTVEEHLGHTIAEMLPKLAGTMQKLLKPVLDEGQPLTDIEVSGVTPKEPGVVRYWLANYYPLRSESGEITGLTGAVMDISERKRLETELQKAQAEAEQRANELNTVFNSISDSMMVYDADGSVQQANQAAVDMLGYDPTGQTIPGLVKVLSTRTKEGKLLNPTLVPAARALRGLSVDEERFDMKNSLGQEIIVFTSATPLWTGDHIAGAVEVWHDVSERESLLTQVEEQRQKAEARANELDVVFNSITNGIIVYYVDGRARRANQAAVEMLGFDPSDQNIPSLVKKLSTRTIDGTPLDPAQGPSARALRGETVVGERIILQSPRGEDTIVLASASPLWIGDKIAGAVSAWQDVTQQHKAEDVQAWLASFPELNPNPVVELDPSGKIYYINAAARSLFPDIEAQENEHAWLNGLESILADFQEGKIDLVTREVQVGEIPYVQSVSFVAQNRRARIYGFDITKRKQAEAQLEVERGNLQMIFDAVNVGMLLIDEGGAIKRSNNVVAQWTDKDFSELLDLQPGDALNCIHALADPGGCGKTPFCSSCRIRQSFQSVLQTGQSVHNLEVETTLHVRGEAVHLWLDISADPIAVDGKKHVIMALSNITAMKEAELALRQARDELEVRVQERTHELATSNAQLLAEVAERKQAEAQLRLQTSAMEAAANGIIITDNQGTIQWCNTAFAQVSGYACEEVIGLNPRFLKSGRHDRAFYDQMWATLGKGQVWQGEMTNRRKDGSFYIEEQVITPVRDEKNHITHFIAVKQDISARKQAEEALRLANAYNRSLLEASLDPLATITPAGKIGDVNSATEKLTGRGREELIGTDFHSYFSDPEKARLGYQKVFEGGTVRDYELEMRHSDGHVTPVLYNASVYRDEVGKTRGVFAVARDITDRKQFEAQLVQAEKHAVIGRMVGSVTHEINNPLQTIKNCLYLIQQDTPAGSSIQEPLDMASSETARLTDLVGQLRELYRPRTDLQEHPHELLDILEEVHALLTPHLNNSRVKWEPLTGLTRCYINCVRDQILEVFLNISMNAIEAMQKSGGTLSVDMYMADEQVGVFLKDSGPGISAEILPHLFEPFQTTKSSGLGLGLSISYGIIQRHGGQIVVENSPEGGAAFTVWLPVARKSKQEKKRNGA